MSGWEEGQHRDRRGARKRLQSLSPAPWDSVSAVTEGGEGLWGEVPAAAPDLVQAVLWKDAAKRRGGQGARWGRGASPYPSAWHP